MTTPVVAGLELVPPQTNAETWESGDTSPPAPGSSSFGMGLRVTVGSVAREGGSPLLRITRCGPLTRLDQAGQRGCPERAPLETFAKTAAVLGRAGPKVYGLKGFAASLVLHDKVPSGGVKRKQLRDLAPVPWYD